ncbi:MAG: PTS sugar transporter subunit IIB [Lachnospiraceae bacterium]|nr:PTS sugar transporter subunit IIB [Lachnospiraceae bacterium]
MVGFILASHGDFAEGIYSSAQMVFGEAEELQVVTFHNGETLDDLRGNLLKAVGKLSDQENVLFMVDLFAGSPYNQAFQLCAEHPGWAIITGLNLPMLAQAYGDRDMATAGEIAKDLVGAAREGIVVHPEEFMPAEAAPAAAAGGAPAGAIPPGTVLGDGHIKYVLARIDTRLLHGQVATAWTKQVQPTRIIVCSDGVAHDELRKTMIEQAAPPGVKANVVPISKIIEVAKDPRFGDTKAMLLFETPQDALKAIEGGVDIKEINVGSMAHSNGKVAVNQVLSLGKEDVETFDKLKSLGIKFNVRKVPTDSPEDMDALVEKARAELK